MVSGEDKVDKPAETASEVASEATSANNAAASSIANTSATDSTAVNSASGENVSGSSDPSTAATAGGLRPESSSYLLTDPSLKEILLSDVGVESLLYRLKQSIHTCKEYAAFIKRLATVESEHSAHIKKVSRMVSEAFKKPELRKGTFQTQILNIVKTTDRIGDAGSTYIDSMHRIHDELMELVKTIERQRKSTKEAALRHEKALLDSEALAEKAKSKYDSTCDELEKARTSDPSKNKLGFKPKSEEDLHRRMTIAEVDYQQKVDTVQRMRKDLVEKHRVGFVRNLQNLILECDQALSLQVLRGANLSETLELNRGFAIAPIKPKNSPTANLTLKEMACKIDNELDFYNYVWSIPKQKTALNRKPVTFRKHPTLGGSAKTTYRGSGGPGAGAGAATSAIPSPRPTNNLGGFQTPSTGYVDNSSAAAKNRQASVSTTASNSTIIPAPSMMLGSGTAKTGPILMSKGNSAGTPVHSTTQSPAVSSGSSAAPFAKNSQWSAPQSGSGTQPGHQAAAAPALTGVPPTVSPSAGPGGDATDGHPPVITVTNSPGSDISPGYPATNRSDAGPYDPSRHGLAVYGTPLDELLEYEEGTVPRIVYQCVQAIDNFGLEVEGIYRTNGNSLQVQEIRREFDIDASQVDLLRPSETVNDIHSVASALKQYFQSLPDPLLTKEFHREFINAANIKDDIRRRDTIHAIINKLPDANYTTLRYLIFHLYRVQEREAINRMGVTNLSIVWGPTLMDTDYSNVGEMAVQSRAIETVLINAYAIFEAE